MSAQNAALVKLTIDEWNLDIGAETAKCVFQFRREKKLQNPLKFHFLDQFDKVPVVPDAVFTSPMPFLYSPSDLP